MTETSAPAEVVRAARDILDSCPADGRFATLECYCYFEDAVLNMLVRALNAQPLAADALDAGTVEALKPFAEAAENLDDSHNDRFDIWESSAAMSITAGDLRRAHKLYASLSSGKTVGAGEGE